MGMRVGIGWCCCWFLLMTHPFRFRSTENLCSRLNLPLLPVYSVLRTKLPTDLGMGYDVLTEIRRVRSTYPVNSVLDYTITY